MDEDRDRMFRAINGRLADRGYSVPFEEIHEATDAQKALYRFLQTKVPL